MQPQLPLCASRVDQTRTSIWVWLLARFRLQPAPEAYAAGEEGDEEAGPPWLHVGLSNEHASSTMASLSGSTK